MKIVRKESETESKPTVNQRNIATESLDETYVEATLPLAVNTHSGEQVLGVRWDVMRDRLIFDFREIAQVAQNLDPTKRNVISIMGTKH